jgi:hypothetical protein
MSVFPIAGFTARKLKKADSIILTCSALFLLLPVFLFNNHDGKTFWTLSAVGFFAGLLFGARLSNIYFLFFWLLIVACYAISGVPFSILPLTGTIYYLLLMCTFWLKYRKTCFPVMFSRYRGFLQTYSRYLDRMAMDEDAIFTVVLFFGGIIILGIIQSYYKEMKW